MLIHQYDADVDLQVTLKVDSIREHGCDACGGTIPSHTLFVVVVAPDEMDSQEFWHLSCAEFGYIDQMNE